MDNFLLEVQSILSTTPELWKHLTEISPVGLLAKAPNSKEWSALECLQHVLDAESRVFPFRVQAFLKNQDIPEYDPDLEGQKLDSKPDPKLMASEFANRRKTNLKVLRTLTLQDLSRTAQHSELGMVTLRAMLCEWAAHDLMHIVQAERALMQPFIAGSGPWRSYFKDHDIDLQKPG